MGGQLHSGLCRSIGEFSNASSIGSSTVLDWAEFEPAAGRRGRLTDVPGSGFHPPPAPFCVGKQLRDLDRVRVEFTGSHQITVVVRTRPVWHGNRPDTYAPRRRVLPSHRCPLQQLLCRRGEDVRGGCRPRFTDRVVGDPVFMSRTEFRVPTESQPRFLANYHTGLHT